MIITSVSVDVFTHLTRRNVDSAGHSHPGEEKETKLAMLRIRTENGDVGYAFGPPEIIRKHVLDAFVRKVLIGKNAADRERLWQDLTHWQRGSAGQLTDRALALVEQALWDLLGRKFDMPVYKLLGGYRDKVLAYGSTMCGDELEGGLATPEDYARFAETLVQRGYKAIKLHTWMPPVSFAPSPKMDIHACAAVREAVGPEIDLMLDGYHWYSRTDAYKIGKELERLNFAWIEEPMPEESAESYAWLSKNLNIPVLGPETLSGKHLSRASWVKNDVCDILRAGVAGVGGISPCMKVAHLAESFGMNCEIHGNGAPNLAVVGAIKNCDWYERGLLHPFLEYDDVPSYLNNLIDPMDDEGYVHLPQRPGLGEDINFDYIANHTVERL
ncbi:mandelate racemase family protein [Marinomonas transparens]|uniref:Mandelate racemase family protein n=1 Tax=Marinomonas transparens TaxID=2795388 RepID=A0A934JT38_9GAMM|nr:mandelate racemase family protein [Marinomonas transparens]MBJ7539418.1 mandelate racemase family protein [Marinomonas transparens]